MDMDLEGKLIIKVRLEDDIRLIPIHNEEITYDELLVMMQRIFSGKLKADDDVLIKYRDEDGDMITIFDSNDLALAIAMSRLVKLTLFVKPKAKHLDCEDLWKIRGALRSVRNTVDKLLERLDLIESSSSSSEDGTRACGDGEKAGEEESPTNVAVKAICSKEFDPLEQGDRSEASSSASVMEELQSSSMGKQGRPGGQGPAQTPPMVNGMPPHPQGAPQPHPGYAPQQHPQQPQQQYAMGPGPGGPPGQMPGQPGAPPMPGHPPAAPPAGSYYQPQPGQAPYPGQPRPGYPPQGMPQQQQIAPQPYPGQPRPLYPGQPQQQQQPQLQGPPQQQQQQPPAGQMAPQPMNFQPLRPQAPPSTPGPGYPQQQQPQQQPPVSSPSPAPGAQSGGMPYYQQQQPGGSPAHYPPGGGPHPPQPQHPQQQQPMPGAPPANLAAPPASAGPSITPPLGPPMGPPGARGNPFSARGASAYPRHHYPTFQPQPQQ